ncbi:MAG: hypothetical protein HC871_05545 [Rhizobiales bacterium]|nr:hypothetical protein [Hyphomicrobiales bacterium]
MDIPLAPTLSPGDIVVMDDNRPAHKPVAVRQAIERTGAELRFLPPHGPDFNPIDMAFSKVKAFLEKQRHEPSTIFGTRLQRPSTCSRRPNAKTMSRRLDMTEMIGKCSSWDSGVGQKLTHLGTVIASGSK